MQFLTDFADQAVILPLAAAAAVALAAMGWWRGALAWTACTGGVLGIMGVLKIVLVACAGPLAGIGIHSPSGHTAAATVTYGGLAWLLGRFRLPAAALCVIPPVIAVVIGASRLALHAHVPAEVALGAAVGCCGAAILPLLAGPVPPLRPWPLVVPVLGILLLLHGTRMQAEQELHRLARLSWFPLAAWCRA